MSRGRPTSAGKSERWRNTGGEVANEAGHPKIAWQAAVAAVYRARAKKQASQQKQSGSGRMGQQQHSGSSSGRNCVWRRKPRRRSRRAGCANFGGNTST